MIDPGFQDWPEYSALGDWLDCNAGVPAVPPTIPSPSLSGGKDMPSIEAPPISPSSSINNCESGNHKSLCPPPAKKAKCQVNVHMKAMRLPTPCPLPTMFTDDVAQAIADNKIEGIMTLRLERQAAAFYWGLCPWPTASEYDAMSKAMCDKFPILKSSKHENYWVSGHIHS